MQQVQRVLWYATALSLVAAYQGGTAFCRQTVVTGSVGTGYDYRTRTYDHKQADQDNEGDTQKIFIGPTITIASKGIYDTLDLSYSPQLGYDFVDDDTVVDHNLRISNQRLLTSRWSVTLSDTYLLSDDPEQTSSVAQGAATTTNIGGVPQQDQISRDLGSNRYWTNTASISTTYALAERTQVGGGYSYSVLRNDSSGEDTSSDSYDEYDKHSFFTNLSHGFNQNWRSYLGLNYTRGLYDQGQLDSGGGTVQNQPDLDEYGAAIGLDYVQSQTDFFPFKYNLYETQYDGDTRPDTQAHEWSVGWDHAFDSRTHLAVGGGPSYAKTQGLDGTWSYNAYCSLLRRYEHATWSLQFDKQYEPQNFSGTDESGLTDTYNARANFTYQYSQALGMDLFARYTWQSDIDPQGEYLAAAGGTQQGRTGDVTYNTNEYEAGVGLRYTFARWYSAGLRYSYYVSDGDLDDDQYSDHRVLLTLSAAKELWRW